MERLCHVFRIAPGTEEEYVRRHVEIWPELAETMKAAGFGNYTLFRRGLDVIAYCECEPDVETCFALRQDYGPQPLLAAFAWGVRHHVIGAEYVRTPLARRRAGQEAGR